MKAALLAVALVVTEPNGIETRLFDTRCEVQSILARFPMNHQRELRAGTFRYEGRLMRMCWVAGKQWVFVFDEDGDMSRVAIERFKELK